MRARSTAARFALLIPLVLLIVAATTLLGSGWIPWRDLLGGGGDAYIFWHLRVPRSLLAACAGARPPPRGGAGRFRSVAGGASFRAGAGGRSAAFATFASSGLAGAGATAGTGVWDVGASALGEARSGAPRSSSRTVRSRIPTIWSVTAPTTARRTVVKDTRHTQRGTSTPGRSRCRSAA